MLGKVGIVVTMEGAAQKTPVEENPRSVKRRIHQRGRPVERISRRLKGKEPSILEVSPKNMEMKSLLVKGGRAGKMYDDSELWKFPELETSGVRLKDLLPNEERLEKNRNCFENVESIDNDFRMDEGNEKPKKVQELTIQ